MPQNVPPQQPKPVQQAAPVAQNNPAQPGRPLPSQQQIDRLMAAREMLNVLNFPQVIGQVGAKLERGAREEAGLFLRQAVGSNPQLTDKQKELLLIKLSGNGSQERVGNVVGDAFTSQVFRDETSKAYAEAIANHYTQQEIAVITAFFKTPAGKKFDATQEGVIGSALESVLKKIRPGVAKAMQEAANREVAAAGPY